MTPPTLQRPMRRQRPPGFSRGVVDADADAMHAILQRLYGIGSSKDLSSQQASDLIGRLEAVERGAATLDSLTGADDTTPPGPLQEAIAEAQGLMDACGMVTDERAAFLERMVDQQSSEAVLVELRKERDGVPF